jgi:hypothetical protein
VNACRIKTKKRQKCKERKDKKDKKDKTDKKEKKEKQDLLGQVSRLRKREEQIPPLEWVNPVGPGVR